MPTVQGGSIEAWRQCYINGNGKRRVVASWNANSLRANAELIEMIQFDILAVQESRLSDRHANHLAGQLKRQGMELLTGTCPGWRRTANGWAIDRQVPGVAYIVKSSIVHRPVTEVPEDLLPWHQAGRLLMWEFLVEAGWVRCTNVYLPQMKEAREAMIDSLLKYMHDRDDEMEIILGDLNEDTQQGRLAHETQSMGWRSLASESPYPVVTFLVFEVPVGD